jgi:hypothetical protein|tara:strand:- start:1067 stop:1234 length:168 start_codon:yes stop_codon:yes gene_type:complete
LVIIIASLRAKRDLKSFFLTTACRKGFYKINFATAAAGQPVTISKPANINIMHKA